MDIAAVRSAIELDTDLQALIPDTQAIADKLSGREFYKAPFEIGAGGILATLGLERGNVLLDAIQSTPGFRHVWPMIEQGRLDLSSPLVEAGLDMLVQGEVISSSEMQQLLSLCLRPIEVSEDDVKRAIWNDDGSLAIQIGA
jgi:hypothetical protein